MKLLNCLQIELYHSVDTIVSSIVTSNMTSKARNWDGTLKLIGSLKNLKISNPLLDGRTLAENLLCKESGPRAALDVWDSLSTFLRLIGNIDLPIDDNRELIAFFNFAPDASSYL